VARIESITYEQVAKTADEIKAEGKKPTSRAVRELLGSGSMATVLKHLNQWNAGQQTQTNTIFDNTLDPALARAIGSHIVAKTQEATSAVTSALADLQAEQNILIAEGERQAAELDLSATSLAALSEQNAALAGRVAQLEADAAKTTAELVHERLSAEAARVELAKAELRLEAVPRIEKEIEQLRGELLLARTQAAEQHELAAVAVAKFDAAEHSASTALNTLAEAVKRAQQAEQSLSNERVAVHAANARLEAAAREVTSAQESSAKAQAAAKKAGEEAAELRGQIAALRNQIDALSKSPRASTSKKTEKTKIAEEK